MHEVALVLRYPLLCAALVAVASRAQAQRVPAAIPAESARVARVVSQSRAFTVAMRAWRASGPGRSSDTSRLRDSIAVFAPPDLGAVRIAQVMLGDGLVATYARFAVVAEEATLLNPVEEGVLLSAFAAGEWNRAIASIDLRSVMGGSGSRVRYACLLLGLVRGGFPEDVCEGELDMRQQRVERGWEFSFHRYNMLLQISPQGQLLREVLLRPGGVPPHR